MSSTADQIIRLQSGRQLSYAEYGDLTGKPVVFFQGTPSSRLMHPDETITRELGARLIVIDRPGFGLSDFKPKRTLLDWPDDVREVMDQLGVEHFAVIGISGGGPYVAACAHKIPHRILAATLVSSTGPADAPNVTPGMARERRIGYWVALNMPALLRPLIWLTNNPRRNVEKFFARYTAGMCEADRAILQRPAMREQMIRSYAEAARQGVRGFAWEARLAVQPWGFRLQAIPIQVRLWHGDCDTSTPIAMARYLESVIPRCDATYMPGEGHFLLFTHWREILTQLLTGFDASDALRIA
jgi:pimeloyl-ACP methyl ester carboxylesterase